MFVYAPMCEFLPSGLGGSGEERKRKIRRKGKEIIFPSTLKRGYSGPVVTMQATLVADGF